MPFGLIVGVNSHFQSVIFTGVLLREEKVENFEWVFREFVKLMNSKKPVTILTGDFSTAWGNHLTYHLIDLIFQRKLCPFPHKKLTVVSFCRSVQSDGGSHWECTADDEASMVQMACLTESKGEARSPLWEEQSVQG
jgi:hypothetical protein